MKPVSFRVINTIVRRLVNPAPDEEEELLLIVLGLIVVFVELFFFG